MFEGHGKTKYGLDKVQEVPSDSRWFQPCGLVELKWICEIFEIEQTGLLKEWEYK